MQDRSSPRALPVGVVTNAALFGLAALLVPGFTVSGFGAALIGSILYSIAGWVTSLLLR